MQSNMLSAKKTKVHGMKSRRWNVKDKITQYKGLVNLYARDKKILEFDTSKDRKRLKKEIRKIRREIDDQRETLDNAIQGDRQRLRNTLSENRQLLLAYQNMHPTKVIEVLYQENFNKRKYLDSVTYAMKKRTQKLIDLKLEYADLEDRIKFETKEQIPCEEIGQIITGKVQDAIMRNETARDVRTTYKSIINVLEKDVIYFDAVLRALNIDGYNQGKCILKLTEMGQLATEYLDDKKEEYKMLEAALKISMQEREKGIKQIQDKLEGLHNNVKYLIRRDSVIFLDEEKRSKHTHSEIELISNVRKIKFTLDRIKEITLVSQIEGIFSRFEEQQRQKLRLENLVALNTKSRNTLLNKSKHAEEMYNNLAHVMVGTTIWYKEEKSRLLNEIDSLNIEINDLQESIKNRGELIMRLRTSFQQIAEVLRNVVPPVPPTPLKVANKKDVRVKKRISGNVAFESKVIRHEKCEEDTMKLIELITKKVKELVKQAKALPEPESAEAEAYEVFVESMLDKSHVIDFTVKEESLIDDMMLEDPQVPSRNEIKKISAEICEKNAKSEFDV